MTAKTGLLGGAFNPPHNAHLALADYAVKTFGLDELIFIPTRIPPHKNIEGNWDEKTRSLLIRLAGFTDTPDEISRRLRELKLSGKNVTDFIQSYGEQFEKKHDPSRSVSDIEIDRPEVSYTFDTLKALKKKLPGREFYVIIGMDQAAVFDTWKNWIELPGLARICAANRPGSDDTAVRAKYPFIKIFDFPPMDVSSTEIREKIAKHQSIKAFVPKIIVEFLPLLAE